jgi:hypothetical protein
VWRRNFSVPRTGVPLGDSGTGDRERATRSFSVEVGPHLKKTDTCAVSRSFSSDYKKHEVPGVLRCPTLLGPAVLLISSHRSSFILRSSETFTHLPRPRAPHAPSSASAWSLGSRGRGAAAAGARPRVHSASTSLPPPRLWCCGCRTGRNRTHPHTGRRVHEKTERGPEREGPAYSHALQPCRCHRPRRWASTHSLVERCAQTEARGDAARHGGACARGACIIIIGWYPVPDV